MTVCEGLSERYLWADCLCIVQDDPDDKRAQIGLMASIYTAAEAVLVVASGSGMDQAIPGVSVDRQARIQCSALGLCLTESTSKKPWDLLESSVWATRGWTYQEGILPGRKLYITDREVWFECGETIIREDAYADAEQEKYFKTKHYRSPVSLWLGALHRSVNVPDGERPWDSYKWHLSRYTGRSLSNDRDIFNAFMGILHPLFDDYGGTTFGLPLAKFDRALLWASLDSTSPMRPGVPTWSWGSMRGPIVAAGLSSIGTLVRWSRYSESEKDLVDMSCPEDQWPGGRRGDFIKGATYLAMAWAHGILEKPCPKELDHRSVSFDELATVATLRWPSPRDFLGEALGSVQVNSFNSFGVRKTGILCGRVQTAILKITRGDREYCEKDVIILDHRGDRIGFLAHLHDPTLESQIGPGVLDCGTDGEFVALSVATHPLPEGLYIDERTQHEPGWSAERESRLERKRQEWSFFDYEGRGSYPYPIVNVMLIWTDTEGYSYRIGIGWVMMTKWAEAKRTFKNIALR
ncbi:hypothetical protein SLS58_005750 [Diplodia intermedia]|uniref:Heterokaryon incompatibility domain-containing protein n=1 Tax=Diplodia intermedia TaxID=856260 RepID=A0ABR3TQC0_9PEZI